MPNRSSLVNSSLSRTKFTKRSGEDGAPSTRLSEKSDFKSWGFKMSNASNEEKPICRTDRGPRTGDEVQVARIR
jgi:hypothetical protein